jgi:hypothetical protein
MSAQTPPGTDAGSWAGDRSGQPWSPPRLVRLNLPDTELTTDDFGGDIVWS